MSETSTVFKHPSGDRILSSLAGLNDSLSELVKSFPGSSLISGNDWLNFYFQSRIKLHLENPTYEYKGCSITSSFYDSLLTSAIVKKKVVIRTIQPHFFRGFRSLEHPIQINEQLIVIDGRNSSGKTSLAESIEWLFTGKLARRDSMDLGNPKELENCIGNGFRPLTEQTWVEASFIVDNAEEIKLRRVLTADYGDTVNSLCSSLLYYNDKVLTQAEEASLLDDLFGSVPPLLMQHTLRTFVQSTPANRHKYFERLLQLEELTTLIEKSAVGEKSLQEFHSPSGDNGLQLWNNLKNACSNTASKSTLKKAEKGNIEEIRTKINAALMQITQYEFQEIAASATDLQDIYRLISNSLADKRQQSFPLLKLLRPKQTIDQVTRDSFSQCSTSPLKVRELEDAIKKLQVAKEATKHIDNAKTAISKAMSLLQEAGALEKQLNESQMCPLCNYTDIKTLTPERIQEIESWAPTIQLLNLAEQDLSRIINEIKDAFAKVESTSSLLISSFPSESEWTISDSGAKDSIKEVINKLREVLQKANSALEEAISKSKFIMELGPEVNVEDLGHLEDNLKSIGGAFSKVLTLAEEYSLLYDRLDQTIGSIAKEDSAYNLQALWINCVNEVENILKDLLWEQAKKKASKELELIRNELINIRQQLLESQRNSFNSGMTAIWRSLRCDSYSTFSKLLIPEPHGKGYPIEIEVKAQIDDGNTVQEVDVLKVFSESQVNALAIAAFVTRSKMVGHKMLIFDDPVQSMDEEHFKTFASSVITELLQTNFQVVILTHNDTFARQVSYAHHDLSTYLTMSIRHSKKAGCLVEEGNRRVFERLKKAESQADDGNLDEAWKSVRLAIERLYTVVYMKYGPQRFNPLSWIDQTAEYMWDDGTGKGVGVIIEQKIPGTGKRLKEILGMTVAGAHDKAPNGLTDLRNATRDLRDLLSKLQIGG